MMICKLLKVLCITVIILVEIHHIILLMIVLIIHILVENVIVAESVFEIVIVVHGGARSECLYSTMRPQKLQAGQSVSFCYNVIIYATLSRNVTIC